MVAARCGGGSCRVGGDGICVMSPSGDRCDPIDYLTDLEKVLQRQDTNAVFFEVSKDEDALRVEDVNALVRGMKGFRFSIGNDGEVEIVRDGYKLYTGSDGFKTLSRVED